MTRVENSLAILARNSLEYIDREIDRAVTNLIEADELVRKLTLTGGFDAANITSFKTNRIDKAKEANKNALKMYRWLIGEMSITIPSAYTDAQVDAIDPEIRTHDE